MSKKLQLNPKVSYLLGLYSAGDKAANYIGVKSTENEIIQKFIKYSMEELGIEPNKILIKEHEALFYNSKVKKLFEKALERRTKIFKYRNGYSANYFAGIFDICGGIDRKGLFLKMRDLSDILVLENLGIHSREQGSKVYISNQGALAGLIKEYSVIFDKLISGS